MNSLLRFLHFYMLVSDWLEILCILLRGFFVRAFLYNGFSYRML